jgi:hypothetical protein
VTVASLLLAPVPLAAQSRDEVRPTRSIGFSRQSLTIAGTGTLSNGSIEGDVFDRQLVLLTLRYGLALARNRLLTFSYTPEFVPWAWLFQPSLPGGTDILLRQTPLTTTEVVSATGASPIGFELRFRPGKTLQPLAARFNFTLDVRLGTRVAIAQRSALSVEYVYHHLSNGYRALQNPGLDSQLLSLGYVREF